MPNTSTAETAVEVIPAKEGFTAKDKKLLAELTAPGAKIDVVVPDSIDPKEWHAAADVVSRAYVRANKQQEALYPVLARLLLVAKTNSEIWQDGYEKFDDFLKAEFEARFDIARSSCYEAINWAERFGEIVPTEQFPAIGRLKARIISKAVPRGEEKKATAKKLLAMAPTVTAAELEEHIEENLHIEKGSARGAMLKVLCSKAQLKRFDRFFESAENQGYAETDNRAEMLEVAIKCFETDMQAQVERK